MKFLNDSKFYIAQRFDAQDRYMPLCSHFTNSSNDQLINSIVKRNFKKVRIILTV